MERLIESGRDFAEQRLSRDVLRRLPKVQCDCDILEIRCCWSFVLKETGIRLKLSRTKVETHDRDDASLLVSLFSHQKHFLRHQFTQEKLEQQVARFQRLHFAVDVAITKEQVESTLQLLQESREFDHETADVRALRYLEIQR